MKRLLSNTTVRLLLGIVVGVILGLFANETIISFVLPIKYVLGQIIFFLIPLIIFGFITPSIIRLKNNASMLLGRSLLLAYASCIGSATLAALVGYTIIPLLNIHPTESLAKALPEMVFRLDIPPLMSVLSALVIAFLLGLSVIWTNAKKIEEVLFEFQNIVFAMVKRVLIPILPFFIASNFCVLSYEGALASKIPIFFAILIITILCHTLWISFLYISSGIYAKTNPWLVLKHYGPVVLTALGTQSSAASLAVAIEETKKSTVLKDDIRDYAIPLFGNIHFPGSILDVVFLSLVVSQLLYGTMPEVSKMLIFIPFLGIFAIAAPGLPGGTLITSLGLIHAVLGIDDAGAALMIAVFALLDSFGTTHNITSDGALTLALSAYSDKKNKKAPHLVEASQE